MEDLELRPPFPVDPVEPHLVAPDPGEMGQMYIGAREAYPDGMTLACATPRIPYEDVKAAYIAKRDDPEFSDVAFFNEHFEVTPPDADLFLAKPGQTLDEYTLELRPKFIHPNTKQGHFDVWLPYNRAVAAINATVTQLRLDYGLTISALIKILTSIRGHDFFLLKTTMGTSDC